MDLTATLDDLGRLIALAPDPDQADPLTAMLANRPAWHDQAACRGHVQPDLWFPRLGEDVRPAKAICAECPAAGPCLEWALGQGPELQGIWGGTSAAARTALRTDRAA